MKERSKPEHAQKTPGNKLHSLFVIKNFLSPKLSAYALLVKIPNPKLTTTTTKNYSTTEEAARKTVQHLSDEQ